MPILPSYFSYLYCVLILFVVAFTKEINFTIKFYLLRPFKVSLLKPTMLELWRSENSLVNDATVTISIVFRDQASYINGQRDRALGRELGREQRLCKLEGACPA